MKRIILPLLCLALAAGMSEVTATTLPLEQADDEEIVYKSVENMPQFPGGDAALMQHMYSHVTYPPQAVENNVQGVVIVQFIVEKDGSVGEVKVARPLDNDLDNEAMRVVKTLPKFNPGRHDGQAVRVWYTLPVRFKIKEPPVQADNDATVSTQPAGDNAQLADTASWIDTAKGKIYKYVEEMPKYPGGKAGLMNHLRRSIRYPREAAQSGLSGRVVVQFVVETDGSVGEIKVAYSNNRMLSDEVVRVVKTLRKFKPARVGGEPVRVWYNLPVTFSDPEPQQSSWN